MENGERGDERAPSAGKIFIGGLSRETSTEKLTKHFKKYGEIIDSVVMKHRNTRQPRGFGFVTFADPSVIDKVMEDTHLIDGRTVEIKRSIPRESMVKGPRTRKIFVGGLLPSITEGEFKEYFSQFGTVTESQIMLEHGTGRPRGFGFITFDDEQVVEDLLSQGNVLEFGGKQVEIKKAEPKKSSDDSESGSRPPPRRGGFGYRSGGRDRYDDTYHGRVGYGGGEDHGMRFGSYGEGPGVFSGGAGYASGYASTSFGGYGPSGAGAYGERYGTGMFSQFDGELYGGMGFGSYNSGYGGSGYGGSSYGGSMYGSPGVYRGGYGPTSPYGSGYGYGRGSGRYHPYGRN